jgi:hypothetical protein
MCKFEHANVRLCGRFVNGKAEVGVARGASAAKRLSKATLGMKANSATWKAGFEAPRETPTADEVRRQLGRLLESSAFRDSLRLTSFLKFVVEAALDGKSDRIKSYTIAVGALGRGPAFDPQADPIVRVEAGRLRQALARHYATIGCSDPILIEMPRGAYVPVFTWRDVHAAPRLADAEWIREGIASTSRGGSIADQRRRLGDTLAAFQSLAAVHRLQIAAVSSEIANARRTLKSSHALLRSAARRLAGDFEGTEVRRRGVTKQPSPRSLRRDDGIGRDQSGPMQSRQ